MSVFSYYRTITFDHTQVPSNQTNIPMVVLTSLASLKTIGNGGHVSNASGYDIVFSTTIDGNSPINWETVSYSPTTGVAEYWLQVPTLSSTVDTVIYMCYGCGTISTDQSNTNATWDSNYVAVYHYGSPTVLSTNDSTSNAFNQPTAGSPSATAGLLGGCFNGTGSTYASVGGFSTSVVPSGTAARTLEAWVKCGSSGPTAEALGYGNNNTGARWALFFNGGSGALVECTGVSAATTPAFVPDTNWHMYVLGADGSLGTLNTNPPVKFYIDNALQTLVAGASTFSTGHDGNTHMATCTIANSENNDNLTGHVDELRLSNILRTANWLTAQYNNTVSGSTTPAIGSEQTGGITPINESLSDTFSFSDAEVIVLGFCILPTDAFSFSDAVLLSTGIPSVSVNENFASLWMDVLTIEVDYWLPFSETFNWGDPNSPAMNMMAFGDQLSFSDSQGILVAVVQSFNDTFTFSDLVHVVALCDVLLVDDFTWSDSVGYSVPFNRSFSDFFIWRDAQVVKWSSVLPALTDQLMLSDSVTVALLPSWTPINLSFNESLNLSDSTIEQGLIPFTFSDTLIFSDVVMVADTFNPFNQLLTDVFTFHDVVLISVSGRMLQFADSFQFSDSVFVQNYTSFNSYIRRYLNDEPDI